MPILRGRRQALKVLAALAPALGGGCARGLPAGTAGMPSAHAAPRLRSLAELSLASLRGRGYAAVMRLEAGEGGSRFVSYGSDGLRVYARVAVPPSTRSRPATGWPVVIHAHGWVGANGAPGYRFAAGGADSMEPLLARFVDAGYLVVVPGFRGHGSVQGVAAEGIEWVEAYDNGSYLSPVFYAVDLLHALQALPTLVQAMPDLPVDLRRIYLTGHSQGGDVALTALAVSSSPDLPVTVAAASICAGCFEGRIEQGRFYGAMETSADALKDPRFLPVMPSWWQPSMYSGTVEQGQERRQQQMYDTVRRLVADQADAHPQTRPLDAVMAAIDAFRHPQFIRAPLQLHFSDMDHYSPPAWNESLARRIVASGGQAQALRYPGNTHGFKVEPHWSPPGSVAGLELIGERTLALFASNASSLQRT